MNETNSDIWGEETTVATETEQTVEDTTQEPEKVEETTDNEESPETDFKPLTYTVKVNGEEKELNEEELIANAQKGMDYDRIRKERDDFKESLNDISDLAKEAGMSIKDYLAEVKKNILEQKIDSIAEGYIEKGIDEDMARELAQKDLDLNRFKEEKEAQSSQLDEETKIQEAINSDWERLEKLTGAKRTPELEKSLEPYFEKGYLIMEAYQQKMLDDKEIEIQNERNKAISTGSARTQKQVSADDKIRQALMNG